MDLPEWLPREITLPSGDSEKEAVRFVQRILRVNPSGEMDSETCASLRGWQRLHRLPVSGMLDKDTAWTIDKYRWGNAV